MDLIQLELIEMIKEKDKMAVSRLYDQYAPVLYGVIIRIVKSHERAELILQQTFLKILSDVYAINDSTTLFAWMYRIARAMALQNVADGARNEDDIAVPEEQTRESHWSGIFEGMESQSEEIFRKLYLQGYTIVQTSLALNIPLENVKTQFRGAMSHIRKKIGEDSKIVLSITSVISLLIQYL